MNEPSANDLNESLPESWADPNIVRQQKEAASKIRAEAARKQQVIIKGLSLLAGIGLLFFAAGAFLWHLISGALEKSANPELTLLVLVVIFFGSVFMFKK